VRSTVASWFKIWSFELLRV